MLHQIATRQVVTTTATYSMPIDMEGYNSVFIDFTIITGAGYLTVDIEFSNDRQNWNTPAGISSHTSATVGPMYDAIPHTTFGQIAAKYIRLKYSADTGTLVIDLALNTANVGA